jgi:UDP-3-O-[3-hydroxymyristoyl] glucosamine N-acyltransferase
MAWTAGEIARRIGGVVQGDPDVRIERMAGLADAVAGDISFMSSPRYAAAVAGTRASAVVVEDGFEGLCPCTRIRVKGADRAFAALAAVFGPAPFRPPPGLHPAALVAPDAEVGEGASVGPYAVVESGAVIGARTVIMAGCYVGREARIGEDGWLYPHVSVRERVRIGARVIVHSGAVIGSDGFGYVPTKEGWQKIPQIGTVEVGDDVEIGANATIDRARFGKTLIGNGVKLDNLIQIAHNVTVGDHTAMAAQAGVAGSTRVGKRVQVGGQAGISGHLELGDGAVIGAQAGVIKDVPSGVFVSGYPAMPHDKAKRTHAMVMRLPAMRARMDDVAARVSELEQRAGSRGGERGPAPCAATERV